MKHFFSWSKFKESKTYVIILGVAASIWFLIRVIPKPSRASYPCMQAAAPLMSSFVIYLLAISTSLFTFKKFKQSMQSSKYMVASFFMLASILSFSLFVLNDNKKVIANALETVTDEFPVESNQPIGEAIGLNPGRVVWVHDNGATNKDYEPEYGSNDNWYSNNNTNESIVKQMLAKSIMEYAGKDNITEAWDVIFKAYNDAHGRGNVGYIAGEKIAFKINLTNQSAREEERGQRMDATPQLMNAFLYELINNVGVAPEDITMGDPYRQFRDEYIDLVMSKYPDVYYVDGSGGDGVNQTIPTSEAVLFFAAPDEKGNMHESTLPQQYIDATYVINMACLKSHNDGGITLIAKNHQGSYLRTDEKAKDQYAIAMHYSLPSNSRGAGKYRHTVDYMGHEQTHGKGLLYIVDGLWAGESWEGWISKFKSEPFNDDYPNSLFVSQDPVALESVCYDVLFEEYVTDSDKGNYPIRYKVEIADYLSQMASSDYWPDGITYDPEGDGTPIGSLGVFEHWNNATDRKYSRNLGTGEGIELKYLKTSTVGIGEGKIQNVSLAAPNPFTSATTISLPEYASVQSNLEIYALNGQLINQIPFNGNTQVVWHGNSAQGDLIPNGMYIYKVIDVNLGLIYSGKVMLSK